MEITDEILAKYVDGKASPEEIACVRNYLVLHPEERENLLLLMDDHQDYLGEWKDDVFQDIKDTVFSNVMISAAAFAMPLSIIKKKKHRPQKREDSVLKRMSDLLDELDKID